MKTQPSIASFAAVLAVVLGCASVQAEPLKIRLAWVASPPELPPVLFAKEGLAKHLGQTYTIEPLHFEGTSPMITGFAAGEVDIGPIAYASFATAVQNAGMSDLKIIADEFRDGVDGYYSSEYMVLKDGGINSVDDLKGKVLATNALGTAAYIGMTAILVKHHLVERKDYTVIEVPFPNMTAMLLEKKADLVGPPPVFANNPDFRAKTRILYTQKDSMGPTQMTFFAARAPFLEKNRAAVLDFMEDELRAVRWYVDPANEQEALAIVSRFTKIPAERLQGLVFTKRDYYRDPTGVPDLDMLQHNLDTQRALGLLKDPVDVKKYADLSFIEEAGKRLK
ncbi:MAG TPA: ABC transporter substrate-binding protein [Stellaceae bacterium]|nr:ABC transporter substrate-binding protein [Stellaceae bacterium]